jgi:3-deoxy-D-manno-octulosonic-acid transferase
MMAHGIIRYPLPIGLAVVLAAVGQNIVEKRVPPPPEEALFTDILPEDKKRLWLHAVSVGEVKCQEACIFTR